MSYMTVSNRLGGRYESPQPAANTVIPAQASVQRLKPLDTGLRQCDEVILTPRQSSQTLGFLGCILWR